MLLTELGLQLKRIPSKFPPLSQKSKGNKIGNESRLSLEGLLQTWTQDNEIQNCKYNGTNDKSLFKEAREKYLIEVYLEYYGKLIIVSWRES